MDLDNELSYDDQQQKKMLKPKLNRDPDEDEGTMEYMERPDFIAVNAQESVFDRGSLNEQHGINTTPSIFSSTWK